jgi:hypothetical protein
LRSSHNVFETTSLETENRLHEEHPDKYAHVRTFHSLAGELFSTAEPKKVVKDDFTLHGLRLNDPVPPWSGDPFKVVILDEQQDCTETLYWLICAFMHSLRLAGITPRLVVLGDQRQSIYGFRGSDERYLTHAQPIFAGLSPSSWKSLPLARSFRLSHQDARFLNQVFLGETYLKGSRDDGATPIYLRGDVREVVALLDEILPLIKEHGAGKTAILAPSVRKSLLLPPLANGLSMLDIPVAVSGDEPVNDAVAHGKLVLSTYHQFKGSERDLVIVCGADNSYFEYFGRDLPHNRCPNTIYVALTRATRQLIVVHNNKYPPMPFMSLRDLDSVSKVVDFTEPSQRSRRRRRGLPKLAVTDLIRSLPEKAFDCIQANLEIEKLPPLPEEDWIKPIDIVVTDRTRNLREKVSDLSGQAIMAAFQWDTNGTTPWVEKVEGLVTIPEPPADRKLQPQWFCRKACYHEGKTSRYLSRWIQMRNHRFDWLGKWLDAARERLKNRFAGASRLEFEHPLSGAFTTANGELEDAGHILSVLRGRADIIRFDIGKNGEEVASLWEIKFVRELSLEHAVQAAVYGYLWAKDKNELPPFTLFNVRNGEEWKITVTKEGVKMLIDVLLKAKYTTRPDISTEMFLDNCARVSKEAQLPPHDRK